MTLETISRAQFTDDLALLDAAGGVSQRAIAGLLRRALNRWGMSPKRAAAGYAADQLRAAALDDVSVVRTVIQRMVSLGECDEVRIGHEVYLAPAAPRWIHAGDRVAAYLATSRPPEGMSLLPCTDHCDIVQRIRVETDDDAALLQAAGAREESLSDWLAPLDYLRHAGRRMRRPARSDDVTLVRFWELLEAALVEEGLPLGADAEVRALAGTPGEFFGRHDAAEPEGRWTVSPPDGVWCAYRRGYGDSHWHPIILAVDGSDRRGLDLYDRDEWCWALLARARRSGAEEEVRSECGHVHVTFPAPAQLLAAMDIVGSPSAAWSWNVLPGAPDVWALLK